jgi:hypothetical protein
MGFSVEPKKVIIEDDFGQPQTYLILPHPASEGLRLATRLFALIGAPIGKLLESVADKGLDTNIDLGSVVSELAQAIVAEDAPALVKDLFKYTHRNGVDLSNQAMLDSAFQANYGELAEALAKIIEVNGFIRFFSRFAKKAGANLAALQK